MCKQQVTHCRWGRTQARSLSPHSLTPSPQHRSRTFNTRSPPYSISDLCLCVLFTSVVVYKCCCLPVLLFTSVVVYKCCCLPVLLFTSVVVYKCCCLPMLLFTSVVYKCCCLQVLLFTNVVYQCCSDLSFYQCCVCCIHITQCITF